MPSTSVLHVLLDLGVNVSVNGVWTIHTWLLLSLIFKVSNFRSYSRTKQCFMSVKQCCWARKAAAPSSDSLAAHDFVTETEKSFNTHKMLWNFFNITSFNKALLGSFQKHFPMVKQNKFPHDEGTSSPPENLFIHMKTFLKKSYRLFKIHTSPWFYMFHPVSVQIIKFASEWRWLCVSMFWNRKCWWYSWKLYQKSLI